MLVKFTTLESWAETNETYKQDGETNKTKKQTKQKGQRNKRKEETNKPRLKSRALEVTQGGACQKNDT
jgi:hypothetical protein